MKLKRKIITLAVLGLALTAAAVPARRGIRTVTQPDGTTIEVQVVGDEFLHYMITPDGSVVSRDAAGNYCYATVQADGKVISTGVAVNKDDAAVATNIKDINTSEIRANRIITRQPSVLQRSLKVRSRNSSDPSSGVGRFNNYPAMGEQHALVILVQYKDVAFTLSDPKTYFTDMLNKDGFNQYGGTGCAAEYFRESSDNQYRPIFDVYGPVTLGQNRVYYGGNDAYGDDVAPYLMVTQGLAALKDQVDLSLYDADNDGYVDNVYVFYAGIGEASDDNAENTVWPHSAHIEDFGVTYSANGKKVNRYACSNEWFGQLNRPDGCGTFIHEFSHVLGLPDLYSTTYSSSQTLTPGSWDVLDYGPYNNDGCTPPTYSAYARNAMGWIDLKVLEGPETVSLPHIEDTNQACIIHTTTSSGAVDADEFFLLENRQQRNWDKYLPGHGMLIWHIDYVASVFNRNTVNNNSHQYVDIEEACGKANNLSDATMAGYPFPGTSKVTSFTATTPPAMKKWDGTAIDVPITNISESNGVITFDVCGGGTPLDTPVAEEPTDKGSNYFVAKWQPVEGATDYNLTVWALGEGETKTETADFGTGTSAVTLPAGWSSSVTGVYTTKGNYGAAAPSLKLNTNGAYLETPTYASPITKLEFWVKGQTASGQSNICLLRKTADGWENFYTWKVQNTAQTLTIEDEIPAGTFALRISYAKDKGNVAIDDVVVTSGASTYILSDYNAVSTKGATSMRVNAVAGVNKYRYTVRAIGEGSRSAESNAVEVIITDGVNDISVDADINAPVEYFNLQGVSVNADNLTPGVYIRRQGKTVSKIIIR